MRSYRVHVGGRELHVSLGEDDTVLLNGAALEGVRVEMPDAHHLTIVYKGKRFTALVLPTAEGFIGTTDGIAMQSQVERVRVMPGTQREVSPAAGSTRYDVRAPMPALIRALGVTAGQRVERGQLLVVLETMKMENDVRAMRAGVVESVHVAPGATVEKDQLLLVIA